MWPTDYPENLTVSSLDDLMADLNRPTIKAFLDTLPIQLFLKQAELTPGSGRMYLFLNTLAASLVGRNWDGIPFYDSEAYPLKNQDSGFLKMIDRESETLRLGVSRIHKIEWSPGSGSRWRTNTTLEIPIFVDEDSHSPSALMAVGQDLEYQAAERTFISFVRAMFHEVGNLANAIGTQIEAAQEDPDNSDGHLEVALGRTEGALRQSDYLLDAFRQQPQETILARKLREEVSAIAKEMQMDLVDHSSPDICEINVRKSSTILAICFELLRNAFKYTDPEFFVEGRRVVHFNMSVDGSMMKITIKNYAAELLGRVDLEDTGRSSFGGLIISELLRRSYPSYQLSDLFMFPHDLASDSSVSVELRVPYDDA